MNSLMQRTGCTFGLLGSVLMAANRKFSRWRWAAYLCSNAAWLYYAIVTGTWGLFLEQLGYIATCLSGLRRWFFMARAQALQPQTS